MELVGSDEMTLESQAEALRWCGDLRDRARALCVMLVMRKDGGTYVLSSR